MRRIIELWLTLVIMKPDYLGLNLDTAYLLCDLKQLTPWIWASDFLIHTAGTELSIVNVYVRLVILKCVHLVEMAT